MSKFLKNSYNYGFKQNQKSFGQSKSDLQTKKYRKKGLHINLLETKSRREISNTICTFETQQGQPIPRNFHALWHWKISNSGINQLYMELLSVADDEDYGDFTDINQGFDFVVTATKVQDRPGFGLSLRPKPKQTPISEDADQVKMWLENQPLLLEERFKYTYDKLKEELQTFISGGEGETEGSITSEPAVAFDSTTPEPVKEEKKFTLSTQGTPKKAKSEEFDSLFDDDLPF